MATELLSGCMCAQGTMDQVRARTIVNHTSNKSLHSNTGWLDLASRLDGTSLHGMVALVINSDITTTKLLEVRGTSEAIVWLIIIRTRMSLRRRKVRHESNPGSLFERARHHS